MNTVGKEKKYSQKYKSVAYRMACQGASTKAMADGLGVSVTTINRWINDYETFRNAVIEGRLEADARGIKIEQEWSEDESDAIASEAERLSDDSCWQPDEVYVIAGLSDEDIRIDVPREIEFREDFLDEVAGRLGLRVSEPL